MYPKTQKFIDTLLNDKTYPGANYGFIKNDQLKTYSIGHSQIVPDVELMTLNHLFDVASLTKVIGTTTLILQLWEKGDIDLNEPLNTYYPDFKNTKITILELLTHTSNVQSYIKNRDALSAVELKKALLTLQPGDLQGQEATYTDTGSLLLGFFLEDYYNDSIQSLIKTLVLQPLKMQYSTFSPSKHIPIAPTENHQTRGLIKGVVHDPKAFTLKEHCGSSGLFSSLNDCLIFCQMFLNYGQADGQASILKKETIQQLNRDWTNDQQFNRSLGWDLVSGKKNEPPLLYHTGYTGTFMLIDIFNQEAFVFLSNRVHPIDNRDDYLVKRNQLIAIYLDEK